MNALTARTTEAARRLLGEEAEVVDDLSFNDRAAVVRLRRSDGSTVIAKSHAIDEAHERELDALRLMPRAFHPSLISHADDVLVMEDLGGGESLADRLLGNDATAAVRALHLWARTLGSVASATSTRTIDRPRALRIRFEPAVFETIAAAWGFRSPDGIEAEVETARTRLFMPPARFTSHVVFDACPDNNLIIGDELRLFDFEFSGWGHSAFDAAYILTPFCTCWCLADTPAALRESLFETFCEQYPIGRETGYRRDVIFAGAFLLTWDLNRASQLALEQSTSRASARSLIDAREYLLLRAKWLADQGEHMPLMAQFGADLTRAVAQEHTHAIPQYPAFA